MDVHRDSPQSKIKNKITELEQTISRVRRDIVDNSCIWKYSQIQESSAKVFRLKKRLELVKSWIK